MIHPRWCRMGITCTCDEVLFDHIQGTKSTLSNVNSMFVVSPSCVHWRGWLLAASFSKEDLGKIADVSPMFKIDLFRVWEESHSRSLFGTLSCLRLRWFCRFAFYFVQVTFAIWRASFNPSLPHIQSHSHRVANCKITNLLNWDVALEHVQLAAQAG